MATEQHWHVYTICPVDLGWEYLTTLKEFMVKLASNEDYSTLEDLLDDWKNAQIFAERKGWEGDFKPYAHPRVFFLPPKDGGCAFEIGFVFKQSNNGTTFVISPQELYL